MTTTWSEIFCLLLLLTAASFHHVSHAATFDYPTANLSTTWTNGPNLPHSVTFPDNSTVRSLLLKTRGFYGPSFACGFYCTGLCDAFLFAIFIVYTNSGAGITYPLLGIPQVVWSANRGRPVGENATLQFRADGDLVLRDADGTPVWSTNTSGKSVVAMNVNVDGNLVLVDRNNATVWESFDHPTDTLVPGQKLVEGRRLTANVSASNWTRGQFYLTTTSQALEAYIESDPPQIYNSFGVRGFNKTTNPSFVRFMNGSLGLFVTNSVKSDAAIDLPTTSSLQYMRLESDGHLRVYEWVVGWKSVSDVLRVFPDGCAYPTACGNYGICLNGQCSCPGGNNGSETYFRQVNDRQPNLGCSEVTPLSCQSRQYHRLLPLEDVSYFNSRSAIPVSSSATTEKTCKQACMRNCSCRAAIFQYGVNASYGSCSLQSQVFSLMINKKEVTHYNSSAYIKVQVPPTPPSPHPSSGPTSSISSEKKSTPISTILGASV